MFFMPREIHFVILKRIRLVGILIIIRMPPISTNQEAQNMANEKKIALVSAKGGGDVIYLPTWRSTRTALGDSGVDDGPTGNDSQLGLTVSME